MSRFTFRSGCQGQFYSAAVILHSSLPLPERFCSLSFVGTQFATKVFQDGDLVEVDASQGIVRKLS